jgi:hypothetical protein
MIGRRLRLAAMEMAVAKAGPGGRPLLEIHGFTADLPDRITSGSPIGGS